MTMKIVVDFEQCDSNGLCCEQAPELFRLDDNDFLEVLNENPTPDQTDAAERVAQACPKAAIELVD
ncbi:ferredoxin [Enemella sp. A6]|uniref:ferredoxin n=1 Tax=Enemella sp. A6 TaxID=3440152 RepID=UPI003EBF4B0C